MKTKLFLALTLLVALVTLIGFSPASAIPPECAALVDPTLEEQIECAIEEGLQWLVSQQQGNGSWSYQPVATTGLACVKLAHRGKELAKDDPNIDGPFDPDYEYSDELQAGLDYIFGQAIVSGDFIHFSNSTYWTGIAAMCVAATEAPDRVVAGGPLNGMTYQQVLQGIVNWLIFAQNDGGCEIGGWGYVANDVGWSDNSNSGYATLGLGFAQSFFGMDISAAQPGLDTFIDNVQDTTGGAYDGGSRYNPCWPTPSVSDWYNTLKTGNLLYELRLVDEGVGDDRVDRAVDFIERYWDAWAGYYNGGGWKGDYQAMFTLMKGLEALGVDELDTGTGPFDWFEVVATYIVDHQDIAGFWYHTHGMSTPATIDTAWALLTLEKAVPPVFVSGIGEIKEGTPFRPAPTGNGRAVAYDGTNVLYYTLYPDWNIYRATTAGASLGAIPLAGRNFTCGSLSWDPIASQLWCGSYNGTSDVYTIDPGTGVATLQFNANTVVGGMAADSCYGGTPNERYLDGLAIDPSDGTVWLSGDAARTIYHIDPAVPVLLGSFTAPDHPNSGMTGCNTGIEVAPCDFLELAMQTGPDQGPHVIAKIEKADDVDNPPIVVSFVALSTNNPGIEDVAYDPDTFAPRCALWTNQFGGSAPGGGGYLTAFDVQCTRTIGYWKTHAEDAIEFLPIELGDNDTNGSCKDIVTVDDVEEVLKAARAKDAADMLYAQLLAAKLNVAMKDITLADFLAITPVISDADDLLGRNNCTPDTGKKGADRAEATALIDQLDAFNNMYSP